MKLSYLKKRELINFGIAVIFMAVAIVASAVFIHYVNGQPKTVTDEPILRERQSSSIFYISRANNAV